MSRIGRSGRRERRVGTKVERPSTCLILTEGEETEVNYFSNIRDNINFRYRKNEIQINFPIKVQGLARSTSVLVNEAIKKKNAENFGDVWVVFDKDDNEDFDSAIKLAKDNNINVAWSNESFELWILLHFQNLSASIGREHYKEKLNNHFRNENLNGGHYDKNIKNIYEITKDSVDIAIKRSKKLRKQFDDENVNLNSRRNPSTTVDILVEKLLEYAR